MKIRLSIVLVSSFFVLNSAIAQHEHHEMKHDLHPMMHGGQIFMFPSDCGENEFWDSVTAMCLQLTRREGPQNHLMIHGNGFLVGAAQTGERGRDAVSMPNMLMAHLGRSLGERHSLSLGLMLTTEKWTFPREGYPLILQTGEAKDNGEPYVDAQHPHSSPIMGLTIMDTIRLGESGNYIKIFFAPRGQSADGPIAFMHRPTGVPNPDAPLGHHIGQDVGHITSTVVGTGVKLGKTLVEVNAFNGIEPEPDKVDLPLGKLNSGAIRLTEFFTPSFFMMGSFAYVDEPHPHRHEASGGSPEAFDANVTRARRYSLSAYFLNTVFENWKLYNTLIYGGVDTDGVETFRHSFAHELSLNKDPSNVWTRAEALQRLPSELLIADRPDPNDGRWVGALTLGYTHKITDFKGLRLSAGLSGTAYVLPQEYQATYNGNPFGGRAFLELSGMEMWNW